MQCHNYISDVYNKPNRLKIGENWASNYLQSTCTTTNTMLWVSAAMCGRSRLRRKTSSVYIYLWSPPPQFSPKRGCGRFGLPEAGRYEKFYFLRDVFTVHLLILGVVYPPLWHRDRGKKRAGRWFVCRQGSSSPHADGREGLSPARVICAPAPFIWGKTPRSERSRSQTVAAAPSVLDSL